LVVYSDYCKCGRYNKDNNCTFWLFIQIIVSVAGITKTITVPFGCLLRLVGVVGITKTLTVQWLFIKTIVSVVGMTKTITVPSGCLLRLL
jgi:hypothetical protein